MFRLVTFYLGIMLIVLSGYLLFKGFCFYFRRSVIFLEWEVFSLGGSEVVMTLINDWISLTFIGFVLLISSIVLFYRSSYIIGDKFLYRFIILVFLFVISMLLLIISPNLIRILLGWDGLGLVSYCLVIYYQNEKSANAGILTILSNRVGDVAILLRIAWLADFGSWNFYYSQYIYGRNEILFILFIVILAGMTKRAQIPFSAWLPAAIAAPTPVSALVHSSTLVTAGVYLLIRFHEILIINSFLFVTGCLTIFISGLGANFEIDLKKIIALSTLRQLGVIIIVLSLGFYELSFFHLLRHALFKSLLFLCAGVFIHSIGDSQDIRFLGGVDTGCPSRSFYFVACSLSLCGFPFIRGFYSKDAILESYMILNINSFIILIILGGTLFTVTYSVRLGFYLFFKNLGLKRMISLSERGLIVVPIRVLFVMAVSAGSFISWLYFPCEFIFLTYYFKLLILFIVIISSVLVFELIKILYLFNLNRVSEWVHFVGTMWFIPLISTFFIIPVLIVGKNLLKYLDQGWVEYFGGQGSRGNISFFSLKLDYSYFLNLKSYLFIFFISIFFYLIYFYLDSSMRA